MDTWPLERIRQHLAAGLTFMDLFSIDLVEASADRARVRLTAGPNARRPGGSINGPVQFALADVATYALIIASRQDPAAATVDLTINFLRPAMSFPLLAEAQPLRAGRRLFTADVRILEEETGRLMTQASATYALSER
jgi:uncharacterized protein (TIGR00369 family)